MQNVHLAIHQNRESHPDGGLMLRSQQGEFKGSHFITIPTAQIVCFKSQAALLFQAMVMFQHPVNPTANILVSYPEWDSPRRWSNSDILHEGFICMQFSKFGQKKVWHRNRP